MTGESRTGGRCVLSVRAACEHAVCVRWRRTDCAHERRAWAASSHELVLLLVWAGFQRFERDARAAWGPARARQPDPWVCMIRIESEFSEKEVTASVRAHTPPAETL
jgi:hypothetical protein